MKITVRPIQPPLDYPALAGLLTADSPERPVTPEELARQDATHDPKYYRAMLVAEDSALSPAPMIGMASVGHDVWAHREGKFKVNICIHPDLLGCGIGASLYQALLSSLEPHKPKELHTQVGEAHPRARRFVMDRGFVEAWRRINSRLDVSRLEAVPDQRPEEQDLEIVTYADLAHDPDRLVKLFELDNALWQDVPYGEPVTPRSLSQFEHEEIQTPRFLPKACFIALHQGRFIGYSGLTWSGAYYVAEMTGVLPAFRSKGLASLLKLQTIRYAQLHGNHAIWTVNDAANTAMIQLNTKLGFAPEAVVIRYIKQMGKM